MSPITTTPTSAWLRGSRRTATLAAAALVAGLVLSAPTASAATADAPPANPRTATDTAASDSARLQRALDQIVEAGVPGALLYTYDKGVETALQSGIADLATGAPMGPSTTYRIGSQTKTYVSTAVLQLVARHRIRLDAPARHYLPSLLANAPRVTVRQLLNHTSGIYEFNEDPRVLAPYFGGDLGHVWRPRQLVHIALSNAPVSRPGGVYHYSNTNYVLLGLMIQAVTGRPLGDVLRDGVFAQAGLDSTTFTASRTLPSPAAHGYYVAAGDKAGDFTDLTSLYPYPWASGAAVSTAPDVARFYRQLLSGEMLPRHLMAAMRKTNDASGEDGVGTAYGLGLESFQTRCGKAWGHGGNFPGYITYVYSSPSGGRQTVVMLNEDPMSLPKKEIGPTFLRLLDRAYCGS
ncbi:D-alanyl-D-alanine carboxypeptidase [Nocardioides exalbidus]|uniref:D-alanyl-D-alanine carboxypeptidase n=1 Tax=Nocardioides exalbidus TaxID=402596 RepID=A0A1H4Z8M0_9ACTN|nr:serine hydrolase domain-containing protein [Nocardioides exalbidus]SED26267.1 D-alanyl-D-alanine carboxypeptidase [Nocardioides exalbidus]